MEGVAEAVAPVSGPAGRQPADDRVLDQVLPLGADQRGQAGRVAKSGAPVVIQVWGPHEANDLEAMKGIIRPFLPPRPAGAPPEPAQVSDAWPQDRKFGTVGVVALDRAGHVAAGTSTGGTTAKLWGRVGDVPVIGAGTYASDASCAVSATGTGEYFIRLGVAREICALVEYRGLTLQAAADAVIQKRLTELGGDGGVVAVAPDRQVAWSFNTSGMYRARLVEGGTPVVGIFKGEN